jgi:hypothetical protein
MRQVAAKRREARKMPDPVAAALAFAIRQAKARQVVEDEARRTAVAVDPDLWPFMAP